MLEESDLDLLTQELRPTQHKWESIGYELVELPHYFYTDDIRRQYSDVGDRLREMLSTQLHVTITWRNMVDALRSPSVAESQLADQLEAKYCPSEFTNNNLLLSLKWSGERNRISWAYCPKRKPIRLLDHYLLLAIPLQH